MKFLEKIRDRWHTPRAHVYVSERHGVRSLHVGSDTIQSAMRLSRPYDLELSYTRSMMAFLLFVETPAEILMIGLGGGSLAKFCYHHLRDARIRVVEISPQVVAIARQLFHVPQDETRFQIITADAAEYIQREQVRADVIAVDG
ncbi:MAG TPA: spermidine synthase, partial [Burkholderiales bacterium]|nr:spermidine synthase [Burkholderiales bacterium]